MTCSTLIGIDATFREFCRYVGSGKRQTLLEKIADNFEASKKRLAKTATLEMGKIADPRVYGAAMP